MSSAPDDEVPATEGGRGGWRRRRLGAVGLVCVTAAAVWLVVPPANADDPARASSPTPTPTGSTTTSLVPVTVYGCPLAEPGADPAGATGSYAPTEPDGLVADADCTDASVVAEYCGIPPTSMKLPGTEQPSDDGVTRTYETTAGLPAGAITHLDPPAAGEVVLDLRCDTGRSFTFTAADAQSFTRPR